MKVSYLLYLFFGAVPLMASEFAARAIVERARATVGSEAALNGLITLQISGRIESAESRLPDAEILIIARKPCSQRLEVRIDDLIETTLLKGGIGCVIRSNLNDAEKRSQVRMMTAEEVKHVAFNTRQLFNFYEADTNKGERIIYKGIEQRRGLRCHKLIYFHPGGASKTRYFSVDDNKLISTITSKGVENVEIGEQIVGGIKFPKRIEYYQESKRLHTLVLGAIEVNKPLSAGIFTIPAVKEKGKK